MKRLEVNRIGLVGLGTIGTAIAAAALRAGIEVVGVERDEAAAAKARTDLGIEVGSSLAALADVPLVIEAVPEQAREKFQVITALTAIVGPDAIVATTASAVAVTGCAVAAEHPHRLVGLHFPTPTTSLVEVVRTVFSSPDVVATATRFVERLGTSSLVVGDRPGLVTSALVYGYLNQAVGFIESRYASRDDIDAAMRLGCGLPHGPLQTIDAIGVDTVNDVLRMLYERTGNRRFAPVPLFRQMVAGGRLGVKSGRGFYTYDGSGSTPTTPAAPSEGRRIERVGVVGSGTMATGIVEVFAKAGYEVVSVARSDEKVAAVRAKLARSLDRAVEKGRLHATDRITILGRVHGTTEMAELAEADLVVEAVVEDLAVKQKLFADLDAICKPETVLATSTSSLSVIGCAMSTGRPQDVVGLHFFNPAPVMKLVEVVSTVATAPDVLRTAHEVCERLGKEVVECRDRAGFIVNALLFPYLNDAVAMLEEHYATVEEIDAAITGAFGYPMGPFTLLDVVGLDVSLAIQRELHREFNDPALAPAPLLEHLVNAGYLGRKAGRGLVR